MTAEKDASEGNQRQLYDTTKKLAGVYRKPKGPVKSKEGKVITNIEEQVNSRPWRTVDKLVRDKDRCQARLLTLSLFLPPGGRLDHEGKHRIQWTSRMYLDDLDFADDLALLSQTQQQMQEKTNNVAAASARAGFSDTTQHAPIQSQLTEKIWKM
ncbi:unnamed protein product [Schistosoma margrebowiei]|uniref:Uncharacterized protein n=1 Tax=Schistosoma margrebowiei TaxID=48269 RepID=A0A183LHQ0_9TREM|nr:unnamed protein product [Schistosoma margrebowiei]